MVPAQVKNKMSKAAFLKNNRGINDGADLPEEFMSSLYDRCARARHMYVRSGAGRSYGVHEQAERQVRTCAAVQGHAQGGLGAGCRMDRVGVGCRMSRDIYGVMDSLYDRCAYVDYIYGRSGAGLRPFMLVSAL